MHAGGRVELAVVEVARGEHKEVARLGVVRLELTATTRVHARMEKNDKVKERSELVGQKPPFKTPHKPGLAGV